MIDIYYMVASVPMVCVTLPFSGSIYRIFRANKYLPPRESRII